MRLHRSERGGTALKKPLFLLLLLSRLERGVLDENKVQYSDVEEELADLIRDYGGRPTTSGPKPEQPFYHLASSDLWKLRDPSGAPSGFSRTAAVKSLRSAGAFGSLRPEVHALLKGSREARLRLASAILDRWWPGTLHAELRERLGLPETVLRSSKPRDSRFVIVVLENYCNACAVCGFQATLKQRVVGVDAAHIMWHSFAGPDSAENGLALCKMHHWAFDRGVFTLTDRLRISVSEHFVGQAAASLTLERLRGADLAVEPRVAPPAPEYLAWNRKYVYVGS